MRGKLNTNQAVSEQQGAYTEPHLELLVRGESNPSVETLRARAEFEKLSSREREVCRYLYKGLRNSEIGDRMEITEKTVKFHLTRVFIKMKVRNRVELFVKLRKVFET